MVDCVQWLRAQGDPLGVDKGGAGRRDHQAVEIDALGVSPGDKVDNVRSGGQDLIVNERDQLAAFGIEQGQRDPRLLREVKLDAGGLQRVGVRQP